MLPFFFAAMIVRVRFPGRQLLLLKICCFLLSLVSEFPSVPSPVWPCPPLYIVTEPSYLSLMFPYWIRIHLIGNYPPKIPYPPLSILFYSFL